MFNPDRSNLKPEQLNTRSISIETTKTTSLAILVCSVSTLTSLTGYQSAIAQTTSPVVTNRSSEPDIRANPNIVQNRPQTATSIDSPIQTVGSIATSSHGAGQLTVNPAMVELGLKPAYALGEKSPTTPASHKIAQASDVAGNWAEPFIRVLVEKGIIKGYPDGTFRPDQPVSRAEFAALLNKAFDLQPVRAGVKFKDVPTKYWAAEVIQKAYRGGFLTGYPNKTFAPNQNIIRIQSLVSLTNGSKLAPSGNLDLNSVFGDAAQVPSYGQNSLIAATQRCLAVSQEYDSTKLPGGNFGPNTVATRADVAAYIHQALVAGGKLPALDKDSAGNKYIASCPQGVYVTSINGVATPPTPETPQVTNEEALAQLLITKRLPLPIISNTPYPVGGVGVPNAFGANGGTAFIGASYQGTTRPSIFVNVNPPITSPQNKEDGAFSVGFGLGDSKSFAGLETVVSSVSTFRQGFFNNGTVSFKLHKQFGDTFAVAVGADNSITWGGPDGGQTGYGVATLVLNPDASQGMFTNTTLSLGAGGGRFRTVGDIRTGKDNIGIFGSLGTRISPNFAVAADWNGQDLNIGLPITIPLGATSLQLVPSLNDLVNPETGGSRFTITGGLGFQF